MGKLKTKDLLKQVNGSAGAMAELEKMVQLRREMAGWDDWFSDDITFCGSECDNEKCFRHPSKIKHKELPQSYALLKGTQYCPLANENINPQAGYQTKGGKRYAMEDKTGKE